MSTTKRYLESLPVEQQNEILGVTPEEADNDPQYFQRCADKEIDTTIVYLDEILGAARDLKVAISKRDAEAIREALKTLDCHTDGNGHLGLQAPREVYGLLEELDAENDTEWDSVNAGVIDHAGDLATQLGL